MKNVSEWRFSAPVDDVDLPRIMREAQSGRKGKARGVVRVTIGNGSTIVLVNDELRLGRFDLQSPDCYLTTRTRVGRTGVLMGVESPNTFAPVGAVAIYRFSSAQAADAFVGKLLDRVEVKVEVF
jgi:hypothetical protein